MNLAKRWPNIAELGALRSRKGSIFVCKFQIRMRKIKAVVKKVMFECVRPTLRPTVSVVQWYSRPQLWIISREMCRRLLSDIELLCIVIFALSQINVFFLIIVPFCSTPRHVLHNVLCDFFSLNIVCDTCSMAIFHPLGAYYNHRNLAFCIWWECVCNLLHSAIMS